MLVLEETVRQTREAKIIEWYTEVFPAACTYIKKRGGDLENAKEIFQEALILYYERSTTSNFLLDVSEEAYLMGIVKNLWLKSHAKEQKMMSLDNVEWQAEHETSPLTEKLLSFLQHSGQKCMDLLQSFYYENLNMKEVATQYGYSSERSATVQKFKCLEKVRDNVKQKSLTYEDFMD
ncbi:sigma-70 family RNA polymerase sigma factor [Reichenbachiella agarivorans]|uniref:Sigma-70 family RNA polymerase sigma factor n=1 Tax=Reichenbachiella agarivorans TaxID=2979464 RepID=A0ABY6CS60_9BACT|nr:sigma-70 family RNA polymerase sigma factor [Reichenbachiella agarivorans]UXP33354.1 sigma-70 family RNA polymerase sigma factor [Reichenbachiella agarivorans]